MQWLKNEFLSYLDDWETSVRKREGFVYKRPELLVISGKYNEFIKNHTYYYVNSLHSFVFHWIAQVYALPSPSNNPQ